MIVYILNVYFTLLNLRASGFWIGKSQFLKNSDTAI